MFFNIQLLICGFGLKHIKYCLALSGDWLKLSSEMLMIPSVGKLSLADHEIRGVVWKRRTRYFTVKFTLGLIVRLHANSLAEYLSQHYIKPH